MSRHARLLFCVLSSLILPGIALGADCAPNAARLCLQGNRFQAEVSWTAPGFGSGAGYAVPLAADTGTFWFFSNSNTELVVKVLDGRGVNGKFWVFYGGLSDVEYTLTVTDTRTGLHVDYHNPRGHLASAADVNAFSGDSPDPVPAAAVRAAAPPPPPPAPLRLGPEFQVNVTTADVQREPDVAVAPDGSSLVVWEGTPGLWGRFYDPAGQPRGGEVRIDFAGYFPYGPRVAADGAGHFMVVWTEISPSDFRSILRGRLFDLAGQPVGGELLLATSMVADPDVAGAPGGGFLAAWRETGPSANTPDRFHTQLFDGQGGKIAWENQFSAAGHAGYGRLTPLPPGGFLFAWILPDFTRPISSDVLAQRLDASGQAAGGIVPVATQLPAIAQGVAPVGHPDGAFSVLWASAELDRPELTGLFGRRFAADGSPAGEARQLRQGGSILNDFPEAVGLPSGDVWALWFEYNPAKDPDGGVFSALFDPSWNTRGVSRVNTWTQDYQTQVAAAWSPGGLVAAWSSGVDHPGVLEYPHYGEGTQDGSYMGVFAQRFTTATCAQDPGQLCLNSRFRVEVRFTDPRTGHAGAGVALPLTSDTGGFWFFDAANVELMIKVLDGREVNGHFWVYYGALSDVAYTVTVTDTVTGKVKTYANAAHQLASRSDTSAF